ncbi:hypothetical protein LUZ60_002608 [Juncus effusus]|nr:hypothetical protein LUZ60_002608 [Juncus effusus]
MASLFRGHPDEPAQNPSNTNSTNSSPSKWLVGLVSSAGKLISSVFRSADESGSDEDEFEDGEDVNMISDDEKDVADEPQRKLQESNQDKIDDPKAISPISPSKAAIEQLLTQETFSREESDKLIKLIQSRIIEPSSPVDPSSSPVRQIYSEAVSEAKKWVMEKKQRLDSKTFDLGLGPCGFNTDMTQFGIESDIGSPIDVAKSYMQSKPPWKSPFLTNNNNSTVFKTPPVSLSGPRRFSDDVMLASSSSFNYSFSSSKGLKRDFLSTGLWDPLEDSSRRIRSRLIQTDSSSKLFETDIGGKQNEGNPVGEQTETQGPICENNDLMQDGINQKTSEENAEAVILEAVDPVTASEKNDEQIPSDEGLKEPNAVSEARPSEIDLNKTNSLHESTNKNSKNGVAEKSNMESEFESSTNGGLASSTGTGTEMETRKTESLKADVMPVRKGRKRVVSGRGRGRGKAAK